MKRYAPLLADSPIAATIAPVPSGSAAFVLAELAAATTPRPMVHIAVSDREADAIASQLAVIKPELEILNFPAWDCLPYDRTSPNGAIVAERVCTLAALAQQKSHRLVLTTVNAILQRTPPQELMKAASLSLKQGQVISRASLLHFLTQNGYNRLGKAMEPGEFSVRGDIIDIFPSGFEEGVRLDFFDDQLESIRTFEPLSQSSTGELESLTLHTVSEANMDEAAIARFRNRYRETFGAITKEDPLYEAISSGQHYPGMEHWLPLLHDQMETLFDYLPRETLFTMNHEVEAAVNDRFEIIQDYYEARKGNERTGGAIAAVYHPLPPDALYLNAKEWAQRLAINTHAMLSPFKHDSAESKEEINKELIELPFKQSRNFSPERGGTPQELFDAVRGYLNNHGDAKKPLILACYSEGSRERLRHMLSEHGVAGAVATDSWKQAKRALPPKMPLVLLPLESGVEMDNFTVITEQDVLGERVVRRVKKRKKSDVFMDEAASFTEGELVVHEEHGIGRFEGLLTVEVQGAAHDCLKLVYHGGDKLFIPVENIEVISRFGAEGGEEVPLDKLGGVAWQSRKAKLKERIKIAAEALLKIAAERAINPAPVLIPPAGLYEEFSARFPFMETEDQERSIGEILDDLSKGKPADRLVCGDVGFGKTEVAMRAAFAAVFAEGTGSQVAVVAPTTLLCRQHFNNFVERFKGLPVTIRQLSRLVPAREATKTKQMLKDGTCDIVVGTHALLSKQIDFKNLGLMIVDEEQHFGVAQKERLKNLKSNIHVLTLSATPIPRTLQLALTGVRELSLITTPPVDRLAVRTFVMPFDAIVLREAIGRERHRGGRVFYVAPRIKDLDDVARAIREMAPDAKMAIAHGQMPPQQLEEIMQQFYDGTIEILLSTAIVESGLDIPMANTLIVHKADKFGLSQLYQLRGRVGRGKVRAYAYFTLPHGKTLTKQAMQRLEVMQTLDHLGAGFSLASHDMDIRGFGNLVGEEQSGHIREVGVELYQQMFEEAVQAAKRDQRAPDAADHALPADERWTPQINLGISVLIPESYVTDLQLRLGLYRRMGYLTSNEDIEGFAAELVDRFGKLPEETEHLLAVLKLKILCKQAGVEKVDVGPKGAVLAFRNNQFANPDKLIAYITRHAKLFKLRGDQKLVLTKEWKPDAASRLTELSKSLQEIVELAA